MSESWVDCGRVLAGTEYECSGCGRDLRDGRCETQGAAQRERRNGAVDRRESTEGNLRLRTENNWHRRGVIPYGRRSGDRDRWVGNTGRGRAALSAPQAETCERGAKVVKLWDEWMLDDDFDKQRVFAEIEAVLRGDWTRKDGSTTPRGDVADRRKSADGNSGTMEHCPARRANAVGSPNEFGRRSGDAARWTAPVQETPQTLELTDRLPWRTDWASAQPGAMLVSGGSYGPHYYCIADERLLGWWKRDRSSPVVPTHYMPVTAPGGVR